MNWEKLTAKEFEKAVKDTKTCIIACGVVEKHSDHLPLGTDFLNGNKMATRAAEIESAVVFPPFYFGQIFEAKCFPGTISVSPKLLLALFQEMLDECGRNGFEKIILLNAHGGNTHLLSFLAQTQLHEEKPYQVYVYFGWTNELFDLRSNVCDSKLHGHACECETSISLYNHPELVKMDQLPKEPGTPLKRFNIEHAYTALNWYSDYPDHYCGDARTATKEKGKILFEARAERFAQFIKEVKEDKVLPALSNEFHQRVRNLKL